MAVNIWTTHSKVYRTNPPPSMHHYGYDHRHTVSCSNLRFNFICADDGQLVAIEQFDSLATILDILAMIPTWAAKGFIIHLLNCPAFWLIDYYSLLAHIQRVISCLARVCQTVDPVVFVIVIHFGIYFVYWKVWGKRDCHLSTDYLRYFVALSLSPSFLFWVLEKKICRKTNRNANEE